MEIMIALLGIMSMIMTTLPPIEEPQDKIVDEIKYTMPDHVYKMKDIDWDKIDREAE